MIVGLVETKRICFLLLPRSATRIQLQWLASYVHRPLKNAYIFVKPRSEGEEQKIILKASRSNDVGQAEEQRDSISRESLNGITRSR